MHGGGGGGGLKGVSWVEPLVFGCSFAPFEPSTQKGAWEWICDVMVLVGGTLLINGMFALVLNRGVSHGSSAVPCLAFVLIGYGLCRPFEKQAHAT